MTRVRCALAVSARFRKEKDGKRKQPNISHLSPSGKARVCKTLIRWFESSKVLIIKGLRELRLGAGRKWLNINDL